MYSMHSLSYILVKVGDELSKPKVLRGFAAKMAAMSADEKKAWYQARKDRIALIKRNRAEEVSDWKRECLSKFGTMIKEDLLQLDDKNVEVTQITLWRVYGFLKQGFTMLDIRDFLFETGRISEVGWNKLKKVLFDTQISKIEDLGLDIFTQQRESIDGIRQEIRRMKRMQKQHPIKFSKEIIDAYNDLNKIQMEMTKTFAAMGAVGEKKKGGGININLFSQTPRPQIVEVAEPTPIEVTPVVHQAIPRPTQENGN